MKPLNGHRRDVVLLGASSGGISALKRVFIELTPNFPASVICVMHMDPESPGCLPEILSCPNGLPVENAVDGQRFETGRGYVAVPDHHLVVDGDRLRLTRGPRENRSRPSVDTLFRSASVALGSRVVGVVLTGQLDDGTSGLQAIKAGGGVAMVQDPDDADYPDMPQSALDHVSVDKVVPLADLSRELVRMVEAPAGPSLAMPNDVVVEAEIALRGHSDIEDLEKLGEPSSFSCPECGGPMWSVQQEGTERFRCHTGHSFTSRSLAADLDKATEEALWVGLRTLEERTRMLYRLADQAQDRGRTGTSKTIRKRADEARDHAQVIRDLLSSLG